MSTVIYEFNAYAEGVEEWSTTPGEMVDGVETDYASTTTDGDIQKLTGNECVGTDLGTITKVELRPYAYSDENDELILRPVFGGGDDGDNHVIVPGVTAGWKAWQDISIDTNGPAGVEGAYTAGDNAFHSIYGAIWGAQTFTPGNTHTVKFVQLLLFRNNSPGTVTVSIKAVDGSGHPTGADLCLGITDGDTLTASSAGEWRTVFLGDGASLSASTKYAIVVRALSGDSSNSVCWRYDGAGTYTGGNYESSANSGSSWLANVSRDFLFKEGTWTWAWSDIQNLDCDVEQNDISKGNTMYCGMVQIQVTYTAAGATYNRDCTRTGSVSISLGRVAVLGRSPSRVGSVSPSLGRALTLARGPSRTGSVALSLAKAVTFPRAVSRVGSVAVSLARDMALLRSATRVGSVSPSVARALTLARSISRVGSVSPSVARNATLGRSLSRVGSAATSLVRGLTLSRFPSRVGSVSTSLARVLELARAATRTGSVSLSVAAEVIIVRTAERVGSVSTSLARVLTALRDTSRTGAVTTSLAKAVTFSRAVSRVGTVSVSVVRQLMAVRGLSRTGSVATSLARGLTLLRSLSRTGSVSTSAARAGTFLRGLLRTGSIAVSVAAEVGIIRAVTRTGAVSTSVDAIMSIGRQVTRVGSVATSLAREGVFARGLTRTGSVVTSAARQVISGAEEFFVGMYRHIVG